MGCMGGCGGAKKVSKPQFKQQTSPSPVKKSVSRSTNWSTGYGAPKVRVSFGKRT